MTTAVEFLSVASHATLFAEHDTVARGRLAGVEAPRCAGLLVSQWVRTETVYGAEPPAPHDVQLLRCQGCGTFVVVDRTADRVVNVYRTPGLTHAEREADRAGKGGGP